MVGLLIGAAAGGLAKILAPHLSRLATSLFVVIFLVAITGCFHEDGLADAADGLGGGWSREQVLLIFRDSRIGSYGAAVLALSLMARVLLLAAIPFERVLLYLIAAHVLCRWTTLPLSYYLPAARMLNQAEESPAADGLGARVASLTTAGSLVWGTLISFVLVGLVLRRQAVVPIAAAILVAALSGLYYKRRIGGVTGDCFGATNQLAEIAVYLCGAWIV